MQRFLSWRFTRLCLKNIGMTTSLDDLKEKTPNIRDSLRRIVEYVNENGGFDIVGWVRCGTQTDASATGEETDISARGQSPHITCLWPSTASIGDVDDMRFDCT